MFNSHIKPIAAVTALGIAAAPFSAFQIVHADLKALNATGAVISALSTSSSGIVNYSIQVPTNLNPIAPQPEYQPPAYLFRVLPT
jgi:hypothetical protein